MNERVIDAIKKLNKLEKQWLKELEKNVDFIIKNNVNDMNLIEHTLDKILDIPDESAERLFNKLCDYYSSINVKHAKDYLEIYKEMWT